jgi:hypothetical protein
MNTQFANYATSSAFTLTLNNSAINLLCSMLSWEEWLISNVRLPSQHGTQLFVRSQVNYMLRRGLIRCISNDKRDRNRYCLTRPGILSAQLMLEAGLGTASNYEGAHVPGCDLGDWWDAEKIRECWGYDYSEEKAEETKPVAS